ncbi:hypothetical protein [Marinitenerispora sediminis]|uniref:Uncharacterized protein n=1 Tax=Marinitenerispora sediminis TaxID=1931232 RepID=A0A368TA78_9ACTN|nr:hypothetical protein [Marinitenerispora sediminis]RCV53387.1 hypothetical protein DEF28_10535 [Marinitenerispora sediminis]RCV58417.1 hypothetical protein DEF23_08835 [Marinitenerispora sediminis]RCV61802.1 hypothetical protein DEF24_03535 [Marinitenerispora sediminis]
MKLPKMPRWQSVGAALVPAILIALATVNMGDDFAAVTDAIDGSRWEVLLDDGIQGMDDDFVGFTAAVTILTLLGCCTSTVRTAALATASLIGLAAPPYALTGAAPSSTDGWR